MKNTMYVAMHYTDDAGEWEVIKVDDDTVEVENTEDGKRITVSADEAMIKYYGWNAIVDLMDDEIREDVHMDLAPCTDAEFLAEYSKRHAEKYGEDFTI